MYEDYPPRTSYGTWRQATVDLSATYHHIIARARLVNKNSQSIQPRPGGTDRVSKTRQTAQSSTIIRRNLFH